MRSHAKATSAGSIDGTGQRKSWRALLVLAGMLALAASVVLGTHAASGAAPTVSIDVPGSPSYASVSVSGTVDPEDHETSYAFEYSTDGASWSGFTYLGPLAADAGPTPVSAELTGLKPGTEYQVRLAAENFIDPTVYSAEPNPIFTTLALANPTVTINDPTGVTGTTASFSGTIDPEAPADNPAASEVNWHFECVPDCSSAPGGTIAPDSNPHAVSAEATGLKVNTAYEVKLVAENANGPISSTVKTFTTGALAPLAQTFPGFALTGGTKALLGGKVNPENAATKYWVEYGPDTSYGTSVPAGQDASLPAGEGLVFVAREVAGLQPSTTYHYRLVASNATGVGAGLDKTFTTAPAGGLGSSVGKLQLPDERAWEMVSPRDKNRADVWKATGVASASGDGLVFKSQGSFAGQPTARAGMITSYISRRGSSSWSTQGIAPAGGEFFANAGYYAFTPDLEYGFQFQSDSFDPPRLDPSAAYGYNLYRANTSSKTFELLNGAIPVGPYTAFGGASDDMSRGVFFSARKLTPDAPCDANETGSGSGSCVYEWDNGSLRLGSVLPGEVPSYGSVGEFVIGTPENIMAADGSRFYFGSNGHLYVRENGSSTTQVDVAEGSSPPSVTFGAEFLNAEVAHGARALFQTTQDLVDADDDESNDLYIFDATKSAGSRLTLISRGNVPGAARTLGALGSSENLDRVYFAAENQIAAGQPQAPGAKLYRWEENGGQPALEYLSTLDPGDADAWQTQVLYAFITYRKSRVSPDGRYLAFISNARLTAYDNADQNEVYRFDNVTGDLVCVSCDPSGAPAAASARFNAFDERLNTNLAPPTYLSRNVSNSGRVFFESEQALVPQDSNGQGDVYMYGDGRPYLISSGTGSQASQFLDASVSGDDAFFTTSDRLVGWDGDLSFDAYDARAGGGLPEPPPGVIGCEGDACQAAPTPPNDPTPASASFNGAGNVKVKAQRKHVRKKHKKKQRKKKSRAQKKSSGSNATHKRG